MNRSSGLDGILLVDKEGGWTSHDVVAKVRGITRQRKAGHTGTLDPMATGLVVVCLGQATRLVEYMTAHDKRYTGMIQLGTETDTDDAEGAVTAQAPVPALPGLELGGLARRFTGALSQMPPAYSALKVHGQRAYAVARAGGTPDLKARAVMVHSLELTVLNETQLRVDLHCGPGTYIRSLARDMGREIGCGGHLAALRRLTVGSFDVREALTIEQLVTMSQADRLDEAIIPMDEGILDSPVAILGAERSALLRQGQRLVAQPFRPAPVARVYDSTGNFVAISAIDHEGVMRPSKVFATV